MTISSLHKFLSLKCSGDVLNSVYPFLRPEKEITESMSIIKKLKPILLRNKNQYTIFDFCAGNCLTSSLIAHLFKPKHVYAIDKKRLDRPNLKLIKNFTFLEADFTEKEKKNEIIMLIKMSKPTIIVGVHPCDELSHEIIDIYKKTKTDYLILMPCCEGKNVINYPQFIKQRLTPYEIWCLDLCILLDGNASVDYQCTSKKNIVIAAKRKF